MLPIFEYRMFKPTVDKRINTKDRSIYSLTLIFINSNLSIIVMYIFYYYVMGLAECLLKWIIIQIIHFLFPVRIRIRNRFKLSRENQEINFLAVKVMRVVGIDINNQKSKQITEYITCI